MGANDERAAGRRGASDDAGNDAAAGARDGAKAGVTKPTGGQSRRQGGRAAASRDQGAGETPSSPSEVDATSLVAPDSPAFFEYWNQMDFVSWMGARIVESSDGHATVYFEPGKHHRGAGVGGRAVTGAVQAYIFDIVTGAAVASLAHGTRPQVTVTLDVTYEYPAYEAPLTFEARVSSGGKQMAFVDAICTDSGGRVCSRCRAIYRRFERRITGEEVDSYLKTHGSNAGGQGGE